MVDTVTGSVSAIQRQNQGQSTPDAAYRPVFPRGELLTLVSAIVMLVSFFLLPWFNRPLQLNVPEIDPANPVYVIDLDGNPIPVESEIALNDEGNMVPVNDRDREFDLEGTPPYLLNDERQTVVIAENGKVVAFRRLNDDITDSRAYDEDNESPQPEVLNPNGEYVLFQDNHLVVVPLAAGIGIAEVEDAGFVIFTEETAAEQFINAGVTTDDYQAVELSTSLLIPIMAFIALGLALYSYVEPYHRRNSVIAIMVTGVVSLLYYVTHFQASSDTCQITVNGLGGGYFLAFLGALGLIVQGLIARPTGHYTLALRRDTLTVSGDQRLRVSTVMMYIILTITAIAAMIPFLWMISTSFMTLGETITRQVVPAQVQICNYVEAWEEAQFGEYFINSVIMTITTITGLLVTSILSAYAFARINFIGKNLVFTLLLTTLMIPESVTMIPNFLIVSGNLFPLPQFGLVSTDLAGGAQSLGYTFALGGTWMNTLTALTLPFMASAFSIFLLRQFFAQIPGELWDAARIDGSGHLRFLIQIVLPISRSAILTVTLLTFISAWNAFLWPLIVTTTPDWRPLMVGLYNFTQEAGTELHLLMAGSFITILPMLILYFMTQKTFTEGIATSGLKG